MEFFFYQSSDYDLFIAFMLQPDPSRRPSAGSLLRSEARLQSKVEQQLEKEQRQNQQLRAALQSQYRQLEARPTLSRARTWTT